MPKSTKAIKVTDRNKAWRKKAKPSRYREGSILPNKTILIVCEGQTEKLYFEAFPVLSLRIKAVSLNGQAKRKLVEMTSEMLSYTEEKYDEVWCVFDMDVNRGAEEFADFDNAILMALSSGYKVAYSNDAFELWFYLHYNMTNAQHLRSYYYAELGKRFSINYERHGKKQSFCAKVYEILDTDPHASQEEAIKRAKVLYDECKSDPYHKQNPCTKVYELVEELNRNLRR